MPERFLSHQEEVAQTRDDANAWVARFAPLVMTNDALTVNELRDRLNLVEDLRQEGPGLKDRLLVAATNDDRSLVSTFNLALTQLDSVESDLRKTLARVAPGDPAGLPDLQVLNDRIAERQAREEMGLSSEPVPARLELITSPSNWVQAGSIGLFGIGWTSFTTFHAFFMISGMMKAFGFAALALLAFYAIFFAAGFGMLAAAALAASTESIELDGHDLIVRRKLGGWRPEKRYRLSSAMPTIEVNPTGVRQSGAPPLRCIVLTDVNGRPIRIASGVSEAQRVDFQKRIEAYLRAQPTEPA